MPNSELRRLIEELREAARYCRNNAPVATSSLARIEADLAAIPSPGLERMADNLAVARRFMLVVPDVAKGYMLGCAFELENLEARSR